MWKCQQIGVNDPMSMFYFGNKNGRQNINLSAQNFHRMPIRPTENTLSPNFCDRVPWSRQTFDATMFKVRTQGRGKNRSGDVSQWL